MLTQIDLRHFKCFEILKLPLLPLTLLAGANATGKSSALQALVLLHQTMREHEWSSRLMLNGSAIRLGTVTDVVDQVHGRRTCEIGLRDDDLAWFKWTFEGEREDMSMAVVNASGETGKGDGWQVDNSQPLQCLVPAPASNYPLTNRLRGLTYLTAERLAPQESYMFDDPQLTPVVGPRGEYAVSVLHSERENRVLTGLLNERVPPTLFRQVEARMSHFFPRCGLAIDRVPRANAVTLGIRTSHETDFHRPVHTGFGLTQVLPIIVAALSSSPGDLLLIENPEVHLHPASQSAMGVFLAQVASAGVQVILETHSDHILNGIRRAVRDETLSNEKIALHFFRPRDDGAISRQPQVQSPMLDDRGGLDSWPDGFFDQFDKDINFFAGWD